MCLNSPSSMGVFPYKLLRRHCTLSAPNSGTKLTPSSVRCAPASGRASALAFGHWRYAGVMLVSLWGFGTIVNIAEACDDQIIRKAQSIHLVLRVQNPRDYIQESPHAYRSS